MHPVGIRDALLLAWASQREIEVLQGNAAFGDQRTMQLVFGKEPHPMDLD